jgi:hypothetical protein
MEFNMAKKGKHHAPFFGSKELWRISPFGTYLGVYRYQVVKEMSLFVDVRRLSMEQEGEIKRIENDGVVRLNKDYNKDFYPTREEALLACLNRSKKRLETLWQDTQDTNLKDTIREALRQDIPIHEQAIKWADTMLENTEKVESLAGSEIREYHGF